MTAPPPALPDDDPDDDEDVELPKIHWAWRAAAAILAGGGLAFGTLAVFKTDVEAGPVALLVVGLLFAIVAMSGHVPWRIKIGDNEIELQRERKRRKKAEAASTDLAATVRPAEQPEAVEVVQRVQASSPRLGVRLQQALGYEATVNEMLQRIAERRGDRFIQPIDLLRLADTTKTPARQGTLFDGMLERADSSRRALVEVKASTQDIDVSWINVLHDRFVRGVNQYGAQMLLLVTREPLSRQAGMRIHECTDKVWVQVSGLHDEEALEKAVGRLIGKLHWEK